MNCIQPKMEINLRDSRTVDRDSRRVDRDSLRVDRDSRRVDRDSRRVDRDSRRVERPEKGEKNISAWWCKEKQFSADFQNFLSYIISRVTIRAPAKLQSMK